MGGCRRVAQYCCEAAAGAGEAHRIGGSRASDHGSGRPGVKVFPHTEGEHFLIGRTEGAERSPQVELTVEGLEVVGLGFGRVSGNAHYESLSAPGTPRGVEHDVAGGAIQPGQRRRGERLAPLPRGVTLPGSLEH